MDHGVEGARGVGGEAKQGPLKGGGGGGGEEKGGRSRNETSGK